uniref:Solute carrier family 40 member n=1 Tax=Attheya septentrionalis TaxID=420275 RepID=A0A7S2UAM0_9STRA|mmetsp:Transcript_17716/g.32026  ORF Transcript_17716/g.32026 Transcript_17716/m.32026 type:complete len:574 (+) Transcript_17716:143-1864(+)
MSSTPPSEDWLFSKFSLINLRLTGRYQSVQTENALGDESSVGTKETLPDAHDVGGIVSFEISEDIDREQERLSLAKARRLLYISHMGSCASEVAWQFFLVIFLSSISWTSSPLVLVSSYGLASGVLVFFFGGTAGSYMDTTTKTRKNAFQLLLALQTGFIILCTTCCYVALFSIDNSSQRYDWYINQTDTVSQEDDLEVLDNSGNLTLDNGDISKHGSDAVIPNVWALGAIVCIHMFGPLADLCNKISTVALEKDWIVCMSTVSQSPSHWLRQTNVRMRQIDLACKMAGPALTGLFLKVTTTADTEKDLAFAAVFLGVVNTASVVVESFFSARIYSLIPTLAMQKSTNDTKEDAKSSDSNISKNCYQCSLLKEIKTYMHQPISGGALALALLYLNALCPGGLMTAYLVWRGLRLDAIGTWQGIASVVGLLGTVTYGISSSRLSLKCTAMWSISFMLICLTICYGALCLSHGTNSMRSLIILLAGICASRISLWTFDMSISQLMQDLVPEQVRGSVGGTQQGMEALFSMMQYTLGLIFSNPTQFYILAGFGVASVVVAFFLVLFSVFLNTKILV